jgi:YidC/Oxa1 family membrane protein insertase
MSKCNVLNNKQNYSISFYLGEKQYTILKRYNIHLENLVNFGMLSFICKPIFFILVLLYNLIGNYGWAIILLAVITQIIMLPLTLKSFKTLAIMKRIQPSIKNIQLKYADNPKRMQLEIFNTYKINKINPLGGCLPTILQFPIFWAFFTILRNICELRNEPWILWIKDLSSPDKLFQIGVFSINILPLIMGIIMLVQQKITTTATAVPIDNNIYDKMVYIMPMLFTIMFWSFPSGLVIYWIINNLFSLLEQYYILKK